jgi:hypothetical protein
MNWFDVFAGLWMYDRFREWREQREWYAQAGEDIERLGSGLMTREQAMLSWEPTFEGVQDVIHDDLGKALLPTPDARKLVRWAIASHPKLVEHRATLARMRGLDGTIDGLLPAIDEALVVWIEVTELIAGGDAAWIRRIQEGTTLWNAIVQRVEREARKAGWRPS